jgi:hypothetical protein
VTPGPGPRRLDRPALRGNDVRVRIRIEATDLPGRRSARHDDVHVGVQLGRSAGDVLDPVPADVEVAVWEFDATVLDRDGTPDLRGRGVQGRPGDRFVYLSWGTVATGGFTMFGRSKLLLAAVPAEVLAAAVDTGLLVGRVGLRDGRGRLRMAAIRPPAISWSAG